MDCVDDQDISIRLQALDLGMRMINSENLVSVVDRLLQQLRSQASIPAHTSDDGHEVAHEAVSDDEGANEFLRSTAEHGHSIPTLPAQYRIGTLNRIIEMCSKETYANVVDFQWYVNTLMQMLKLVPAPDVTPSALQASEDYGLQGGDIAVETDVASNIGRELRNVAVRVQAVRADAVAASYSLIASYADNTSSLLSGNNDDGVLAFAAWVVGEFFASCGPSDASLEPFIHPKALALPPTAIATYLQAIPKVLTSFAARDPVWNSERQTMVSLLLARVIHFLDPLLSHPSVEVQERSVELYELMRIMTQEIAKHDSDGEVEPLVPSKVLPRLFGGFYMNPVAPTAQQRVPLPLELDLEIPINKNLPALLRRSEDDNFSEMNNPEFDVFYNQRLAQSDPNGPAFDIAPTLELETASYQQSERYFPNNITLLQKRHQRRERNKDDPFYIGNDDASSETSTSFNDIFRSTDDGDLDVDSIPIMNLDLGDKYATSDQLASSESSDKELKKSKQIHTKKVHITGDENIVTEAFEEDRQQGPAIVVNEDNSLQWPSRDKVKKSLLQVDSSGLSTFPLVEYNNQSKVLEIEKREIQDEEMNKALAEVERLRLEMQRASERVQAADGIPPEGTLVKQKKKKKKRGKTITESILEQDMYSPAANLGSGTKDTEISPVMKIKKKKKKRNPDP